MSKDTTDATPFYLELEFLGNLCTAGAGVFFYIVCMLLPMVGPSGGQTVHYQANFLTFLAVTLIALGFSVAALKFKLERRKRDQSPFPLVSAGFTAVYVVLLLCLL
ncbi:MAG: hypothetical protein ACI9QL_001844, partial [Candidatus Omnitrophota bacterium]